MRRGNDVFTRADTIGGGPIQFGADTKMSGMYRGKRGWVDPLDYDLRVGIRLNTYGGKKKKRGSSNVRDLSTTPAHASGC